MDTIFRNSENSKTSNPHRLLLNLSHKIDLMRSDKYIGLLNLTIYHTWKNIKKLYKNNTFKISGPTRNERFKLPDHILYQILKINLSISSKKMKQ